MGLIPCRSAANHAGQTAKQTDIYAHTHTYIGKLLSHASLCRHLVLRNTLWARQSYNVVPGGFGTLQNPPLSQYQGPGIDILSNSKRSFRRKRSTQGRAREKGRKDATSPISRASLGVQGVKRSQTSPYSWKKFENFYLSEK